MKTADIKSELHNAIDNAPSGQLKNMYGIILNYLNGNSTEEWDLLSKNEQQKTLISIQQADQKQGELLSTVTERLRKKYEGK